MSKRPMIIDCDTGTDDAIALVAGLYSEEIELLALTTVNGNVPLSYTSKNTLDLARSLQFDLPVAGGAAAPMVPRGRHHADVTHGRTGLGCVTLPDCQLPFSPLTAVETLYTEAVRCGGRLEITALGPLTNLGLALLQHPDLKNLIRHIWIMGGAIKGGNAGTAAEFNIWVDPEAARLVFESGIPLTMVGLDVTTQAVLNEEDAAALRALHTPAGDIVAQILEFMFARRDEGGEDALMHDALALGAALCPQCLVCRPYYVAVECAGTYTYGHTSVDLRHRSGKEPNANVAEELDLPVFKAWLHRAIGASARQ